MMQTTIRLATPEDIRAMAMVHAQSWEVAYAGIIPPAAIQAKNATRMQMYQEVITPANEIHYVITAAEMLVGLFAIGVCQDEQPEQRTAYELYGLYIDPARLHQGFGSQVLAFTKQKAQAQGLDTLVVWVLQANTAARAFYRRHGFREDGAKKPYHCGGTFTCLRMTSRLDTFKDY